MKRQLFLRGLLTVLGMGAALIAAACIGVVLTPIGRNAWEPQVAHAGLWLLCAASLWLFCERLQRHNVKAARSVVAVHPTIGEVILSRGQS